MTRGMKISIVAVALIGLTIGAAFGVKQGVQFSRSLDEGELMFVSYATAEFAAKQFKYADGAPARRPYCRSRFSSYCGERVTIPAMRTSSGGRTCD